MPDIPTFMREFFPVECASIVDVFCEPPFAGWEGLADHEDLPLKYYFAMGCHPHNAREYTDESEKVILEAMKHPYVLRAPLRAVCILCGGLRLGLMGRKCVAWGEMGLDYHYDHSPRDIQQRVLIRQIKHAVALNKRIVSMVPALNLCLARFPI